MFAALTVFFALAALVVALVGVRLTIYGLADGKRSMEWVKLRLHEIEAAQKTTTSASVLAQVDDLRGALDAIRASNRKEFGSLWGRMGGKPAQTNGEMPHAANDDAFERMLAFQATPPVETK